MDYTQARRYLEQANRQGMSLGLERMRRLMDFLGNPQDQVRFLSVAGTNGKGSTAAFLSEILHAAGFRTGRYTSPAVFDFREQYWVDGEQISPAEAAQILTEVAGAAAQTEAAGFGMPTSFEQETALAFVWFARRRCDLAVLETGLGGDEDATNIIRTTVCSIFTEIGLDHTRILGDSLEEIAGHKAGILRAGVPAATWRQRKEADGVLRKRCRCLGCPVFAVEPEQLTVRPGEEGLTVSYREFGPLATGQRAPWQAENLAVALEAVRALRAFGYAIDDGAVREGVRRMRWPGRFEVIRGRAGEPGVILDGAHNPDGAAALRRGLDTCFPGRPRVFVMGVLADKDYRTLIRTLLEGESSAVTLKSDSPRALPAERLAEEIRAVWPQMRVTAAESAEQAMELARAQLCRREDPGWIVVCGSLSFMKELVSWRSMGDGSGKD